MIRVRITKSKVSDDFSVRVQLEYARLRNTNRGRNIDKRTFDAITNVHMDQPIFKKGRSKCEDIR